MLHFQDYGDFADYFGPCWNYHIGDIIAAVPVPMKFAKGDFECGVAAKILGDYAENPAPYLDEDTNKKPGAAQRSLLRKFTELAFGELMEIRSRDERPTEADNIDVGPLTEADLQAAMFESSDDPF